MDLDRVVLESRKKIEGLGTSLKQNGERKTIYGKVE